MSGLNRETLEYLYKLHYITREQKERIAQLRTNHVFSLHYELRWIMWAGIGLLFSGLIVFGYNTISTIGQHVLVVLLFIISAVFIIIGRRSTDAVFAIIEADLLSRWLIFLGCIFFAVALGFWQYAFAPFDSSWELVGILLAGLFLLLAYRFGHAGVLALALVCFGLSLGLLVVPHHLIVKGYVPRADLISVGYAYGSLLLIVGSFTYYLQVRKEFTGTYVHMAAHFLFITTLAGLITGNDKLLFVLILLTLCYCGIQYARRARTFALLLSTAVYGYLGIAYILSRIIADPTLQTMYVLVSCAGVTVGLWTIRRSFGES